ncbi:pseudouridine-5-phosphate glycosidase [Azospirillum sp. TSA6c]|uniref:pseudouridine-5'-phosphate glycosidase n=1 Tax=Azospirillum sp. TSA6c TaxID=709813 RepID=UPI000D60B617|nr:pseudouridine-5'-phosphate glycosidase [Azospirillum sp. TSA6c]PWC50697.1 pseudouridine-5-phosphate glycosidase [Azospirillum sp. TSA6c]
MHPILLPTPEIADALAMGRPVVALESTVISHGMPYPRNLETARALEAEVRAAGAVPATIAVMDGRIRIGLDDDALERLATAGHAARKLSRRDLPVALATRVMGATTVAATMIGARLAGIPVFATGGIGGVHRGAETSFDISADLDELARTSVCVVCAGAKSILDLPKTLELLETRGVPVLGFGTDEFPAFYSRRSGLPVDHRCDNVQEVAEILRTKWQLGLEGGVLLANPIPPADELDADAMEAAVAQALADADAKGIKGKDITPHLLAALEAITGGRSLTANIALIRNNAQVAAGVAAALVGT